MTTTLGTTGCPWTDAENDLLVEDYLDMVTSDVAGRPVAKTERRRSLRKAGLGARSLKSIEAKQQNLSAVFALLGYRHAIGLKPLANYQDALVEALQRNPCFARLDEISAGDLAPTRMPAIRDDVFVQAPNAGQERVPERLAALVRKMDPAERDRRARELGKAGEAFVLDVERRRLAEAGRSDLLNDLEWVADTQGDGLGYDVRSFDAEGREMHIEVKTTNGGSTTPFTLTANEERVSRRDGSWKLYRVHDFFQAPRIFVLDPPLDRIVDMRPATWKVSPGRAPGGGVRT